VRIFWNGGNLIDSARLVSATLFEAFLGCRDNPITEVVVSDRAVVVTPRDSGMVLVRAYDSYEDARRSPPFGVEVIHADGATGQGVLHPGACERDCPPRVGCPRPEALTAERIVLGCPFAFEPYQWICPLQCDSGGGTRLVCGD
jgi:hypothetical protein